MRAAEKTATGTVPGAGEDFCRNSLTQKKYTENKNKHKAEQKTTQEPLSSESGVRGPWTTETVPRAASHRREAVDQQVNES